MNDTELRERLFAHLQRGGTWAYYWTLPNKQSYWHPIGENGIIPKGAHVYFGVHPTGARRSPTQRSRIADVTAINCLFAEFDAKQFGDSKDRALKHINALPLPPSIVIDSGGGYHCYWLLDEPFIIASEDDRARIDRVQKAWVAFVGSDDGAKDLARILRVPGTKNTKYRPARPVTFQHANFNDLYNLEDLEAISVLPAPVTSTPTETRAASATRVGNTYAQAALAGELARVRSAQPSTRNTTLNKAAYSLGQLVGVGVLDQGRSESDLISAALAAGLTEREAQRTINSGITAGIAKPRQIPTPTRQNAPADPDLSRATEDAPAEENDLPTIRTNGRELRDISAEAMQALTGRNIFVRSGELVRVGVDEKGHARIETMSESALRGMLARAANFCTLKVKRNNDGGDGFVQTPTEPPLVVRSQSLLT